jgi:hypothetical protein
LAISKILRLVLANLRLRLLNLLLRLLLLLLLLDISRICS